MLQEPCSASSNLFRIGALDLQNVALLRATHQLVKQPFFYALRTQQQLGYLVHATINSHATIYGLNFQIQTEKVNLKDMISHF